MDISLEPLVGFLILFSDHRLRDYALDCHDGIDFGGPRLHFRPWSRMADADSANLPFKMRVCIEGVPCHGRQPETVKQLFHPDTLIECIDRPTSDKESACCCVKLWTSSPDGFALEGKLHLHESVARGARGHGWSGPVGLLGYDVVTHIDYVLDYSPPASPGAAWPARSRFNWALGLRDDNTSPSSRRHNRHDPPRRDRSPSPGPGRGAREGSYHSVYERLGSNGGCSSSPSGAGQGRDGQSGQHRWRRHASHETGHHGTGLAYGGPPTHLDGAGASRDPAGFDSTPRHNRQTSLPLPRLMQPAPTFAAAAERAHASATRARLLSSPTAHTGSQPSVFQVSGGGHASPYDMQDLRGALPTTSPQPGGLPTSSSGTWAARQHAGPTASPVRPAPRQHWCCLPQPTTSLGGGTDLHHPYRPIQHQPTSGA